MADAPGTESPNKAPTTGSTKGSKTGPVKPPVLEGTARPAATVSEKPATAEAPTAKAAPQPQKEPPVPPVPPIPPKSAAAAPPSRSNSVIAGIVGGVIGLGAAYGLAAAGLWPQPPAAPVQSDNRIGQFATAVPQLQTATDAVQAELADISTRIASLEQQLVSVETPAVDPALEQEVAALAAQIESLSVPGATSGVSVEAVEDLKSQLQLLRSEFADASSALEATQSQLSAVATSAQANTSRTDRLALSLSSLDFAFANARPYAPELSIIRQEMPSSAIPAPIASKAETGLPRPGDVMAKLNTVLPDMLAGQPLPENASWQDTAAGWFRGVIALRPSAQAQGDSPEAVVARLEAATQRADFDTAFAEFSKLPQAMQSAAGDLGTDLETLAIANSFLVDIRAQALNAEAAQ
ncbi:hypothetical protein JHL21_10695 [Devosia sp. WQ 349]|uniref:COG4223 family protein n=1 Tax=Devosia sp. WQ 349K1 TaxID=2800329 RepID=UPI0019063A44|nr:hypothetical protein [Devosia sp. WQ 349K1]MBK1794964.1 hypothetical protein [Devosia sp. WQ 349K1]